MEKPSLPNPEQTLPTPEPILPIPRKKLRLLVPILIIIFLLIVGSTGFYFFKTSISNPTPTPTLKLESTPSIILGASPTPDPTATWKTYTSVLGKYSMEYPANYKLLENEKGSVDGITVKVPQTTTIISPSLSGLNTNFQMSVSYQNGAENLSDKQIAEKIGTTILAKPYRISEENGLLFEDTPLGPFGSSIIYIKNNGKAYQITIESQSSFSLIKTYVDQILSTFKFTK